MFSYDEGTDVHVEPVSIVAGQTSDGLRILRSRADRAALHLMLEGRGGRRYPIRVRTPRRLGETADVSVRTTTGGDQEIEIAFTGPTAEYVRRDITIPLR